MGSVQTLMRQKRLSRFAPDHFDTIIIDEAHHAVSGSYTAILDYFSAARVLGVTATPDRGDMRNLGQIFDSLAYEYTLPQAIREGYLCPIKALTVPLRLDLSGVGMSGGDFKAGRMWTVPWTPIWSRSPPRWRPSAPAAKPWSFCRWSKPARNSAISSPPTAFRPPR